MEVWPAENHAFSKRVRRVVGSYGITPHSHRTKAQLGGVVSPSFMMAGSWQERQNQPRPALRGRPPLAPFARAAVALAVDVAWPACRAM